MKLIDKFIYARSMKDIMCMMIASVLIWSVCSYLLKQKFQRNKEWCKCNVVLSGCMVLVIFGLTIASRNGENMELILSPFHSFLEAQNQPEIYRSMLMNVFLFFPLGLTLPFALPEKWNRKALITIVFAFILSFAIEFLQFYYHLGRAETDDIFCNTLGAAIGTLSYKLERKFFAK